MKNLHILLGIGLLVALIGISFAYAPLANPISPYVGENIAGGNGNTAPVTLSYHVNDDTNGRMACRVYMSEPHVYSPFNLVATDEFSYTAYSWATRSVNLNLMRNRNYHWFISCTDGEGLTMDSAIWAFRLN